LIQRTGKKIASCLIMALLFYFSPTLAEETSATNTPSPEKPALRILLFPFMQSTLARSWWKPYQQHILEESGVLVEAYTIDSFYNFLIAGSTESYDLYVTPGHMYATFDQLLPPEPIIYAEVETDVMVIALPKYQTNSLEQAKGHCIAFPDRLSWVSMMYMDSLKDQGMFPYHDFFPVFLNSHSDVILHVLKGKCPLGVTIEVVLRQMGKNRLKLKDIRAFEGTGRGIGIFARHSIPEETVTALQKALVSFGKTEASKPFMARPLYVPFEVSTPEVNEMMKQDFQSATERLSTYLSLEQK